MDISSQLKLATNLKTRLIEVDSEAISKAISSAYFKNLADFISPQAHDQGDTPERKVNGLNLKTVLLNNSLLQLKL